MGNTSAAMPPKLTWNIIGKIGTCTSWCALRTNTIDNDSISPDTTPDTKPHSALPLCRNSGLPISTTPATASSRLPVCSSDSRSLNHSTPIIDSQKICKLFSSVEMPGPTA